MSVPTPGFVSFLASDKLQQEFLTVKFIEARQELKLLLQLFKCLKFLHVSDFIKNNRKILILSLNTYEMER